MPPILEKLAARADSERIQRERQQGLGKSIIAKIVSVDVYVTGCPPRPENLFYALLKLQDKIDTMTLAKKPTEVRLDPNMVENFKRQVMIAQTLQPK